LDFGPSPYSSARVRLSCYSYPTFTVKEYDEGEEGVEWLAVVPTKQGEVASCATEAAIGEWRIERKDWCEYFKGAKGNLVFTVACDGANGGLGFAVYDSTSRRKIFEDSAAVASRAWVKRVEDSPWDRFRFGRARDGQAYLRYLRVVTADCDLHLEKTSCWERTKISLDLRGAEMPVCGGYEGVSDRQISAVAYPVEVFLIAQPTMKTLAGQVKCWPVD
jgi:hypothetical protein